MDNDKNTNPLHSPHIQALRQLLKHGYEGTIEETLEQLEDESETDPDSIRKLNEEWNAILYAAKSIDHLMLSTFDFFPQLHRISPEAQAILMVMIRTQEQATGYVEVQKGMYAKVLGWGSKRAGRIAEYLQELKNVKAIFPVYEPQEGNKKNPAIYQINQQFSKIGKGFKVGQIGLKSPWEYTQYSHKVTLLINGHKQQLTCGSIQKIINLDANKKGVSAGHTGTTQQSIESPAPHNHYKQNESKISTPIDSNMQKNADSLTPAKKSISPKKLNTGSGGFSDDPNLPFNDMDSLPGQMTLSDMPGVMPNNTEENEP